jgi:hypothetical protein
VHAQLQQLTGDARVAPARVLSCQAQDKVASATLNRWSPAAPLWLRPPAAHEPSMPAQQRLRADDQAASTSSRSNVENAR